MSNRWLVPLNTKKTGSGVLICEEGAPGFLELFERIWWSCCIRKDVVRCFAQRFSYGMVGRVVSWAEKLLLKCRNRDQVGELVLSFSSS